MPSGTTSTFQPQLVSSQLIMLIGLANWKPRRYSLRKVYVLWLRTTHVIVGCPWEIAVEVETVSRSKKVLIYELWLHFCLNIVEHGLASILSAQTYHEIMIPFSINSQSFHLFAGFFDEFSEKSPSTAFVCKRSEESINLVTFVEIHLLRRFRFLRSGWMSSARRHQIGTICQNKQMGYK